MDAFLSERLLGTCAELKSLLGKIGRGILGLGSGSGTIWRRGRIGTGCLRTGDVSGAETSGTFSAILGVELEPEYEMTVP